jgi:outer membrane lipopolysaccharide assembly protein LptE/RlpB
MPPERLVRLLLPMTLALLLAACGFQPRGTGDAATTWPETLARLQVDGADLAPGLERRLGDALRRAGAEVVDAAGEEGARLEIRAFDEGEDLLALGVGSTVRDLQLSTRIDYTLHVANANARSGSVAASRTVRSSADQVNAALSEARRVKRELRDEVIAALVRRLAAGG